MFVHLFTINLQEKYTTFLPALQQPTNPTTFYFFDIITFRFMNDYSTKCRPYLTQLLVENLCMHKRCVTVCAMIRSVTIQVMLFVIAVMANTYTM